MYICCIEITNNLNLNIMKTIKNKIYLIIVLALCYFPVKEYLTFVYYQFNTYYDCGVLVKKFEMLQGRGRTEYNFIVKFEERGIRVIRPATIDYQTINIGDNVCYKYNPICEKSNSKENLTFLGVLGLMIIVFSIIYGVIQIFEYI